MSAARTGPAIPYRTDIDGLRAVAVIAVVLFHAGVPGFSGGFVGVDVFFVISGFLICSLIVKGIERGTFSLKGFYERRARRILPALFTVVWVSAVIALLVLPPWQLAAFTKSVLATALFGSNILFFFESGYFAAPAEAKPLLHTWSLAVEEQYYIVFPLLILAAVRLGWRLPRVMGALAALSFAAAVLVMEVDPTAAFYLAPYRAWELLLGVLVALNVFPRVSSRWRREVLAALGIVLIAVSVTAYSSATKFPGASALLPALGTMLLIGSGMTGTPTRVARWLMWGPLVFVGLVSYSLYLWHWPLLALARAFLAQAPGPLVSTGVVALSFLAAVVSWRFVERPFRRRGEDAMTSAQVFSGAGLALSATVLVALLHGRFMAGGDGAVEAASIRGPEDYRAGSCFLQERQAYRDWAGSEACSIGARAEPVVLLWGDSFAAHYAPGLSALADELPFRVVQYSAYACPPVLGAEVAWAPECGSVNAGIEAVIDRVKPDLVIVGARWERYWGRFLGARELQATLDRLDSWGLDVVLIGQGPSFPFDDPRPYLARTDRPRAHATDVRSINEELRGLHGYAAFFDPSSGDCVERECLIFAEGDYLYWDSGHYSTAGSTRVSRRMVSAVRALLP